jgi:hypothetical protein
MKLYLKPNVINELLTVLLIGRFWLQISVWRVAILTEVSFPPLSFQANARMVPFIKPRLLPSTSFKIHHLSLHSTLNSLSWLIDWLYISMGWDYISELRPLTSLLFISQMYVSIENHGRMISTEENSWFVHQNSLAVLPAVSSSSKQEEWAKKIMTLNLLNIFVYTSQVISYMS